jgi:O-antigen/teichoic acid export membrane protein
MLLAATFAINSLVNFALGLLIALFLGPEAFGLYAVGAALMVFVNIVAIDWLKLSTIRFYTRQTHAEGPRTRATLEAMVALCSLALVVPLGVALLAGFDLRLPTALVAGAVMAGVMAGLFDYQQAVARAREEDAAYVRMVLIRNVLALTLMVGGAWWTRDPVMVFAGSVLSSMAAVLVIRRAFRDQPAQLADVDWRQAGLFARYAYPLVATNMLLATIPLLNRTVMAGSHGLAEAGYFALASDLGVKLMGTLGATLEIMLLPLAIKALERGGPAAAQAQVRQNLLTTMAVILPTGLMIAMTLPALEAVLVPPAFRGHFASYMLLLLPAFMALPLMQMGFAPIFMVMNRTLIATLGAALAVVVNGVLLLALWAGAFGPVGPKAIALAMSAGFVACLVLVAALALREAPIWPRWRDCAVLAAALLAMAGAAWALSDLRPAPLALAAQGLAGFTAYGFVALAGDLGGVRRFAMARLSARRARPVHG